MYKEVFVIVIIAQTFALESLAASESCYYCSGTPQCGDPLDYTEVEPRDCVEESVCVKFASSSINLEGIRIYPEQTYRECFQPSAVIDMDICSFVKNSQQEELEQLNYTLDTFECSVCDTTNCNGSYRALSSFTSVLFTLFFMVFLYLID